GGWGRAGDRQRAPSAPASDLGASPFGRRPQPPLSCDLRLNHARHYPMFRHRSATPAGVTGNGDVRSLGDNVTSILGSAVNARADTATASITAVGGQQSGTGQPR